MFNRATKYSEKGNYAKAVSFFKKTLKEREFKEAYLNLGNTYRLMNSFEQATLAYLKAASLDVPFHDGKYGVYPSALNNLGLLEYAAGNDSDAITFYTACLAKDPMHMEAIWNHASAYMRQGCSGIDIDWDLGWKMYAYRFKRLTGATRIEKSLPDWDGVSFVNKIVVLAEQGIGDKLMFGRYIHLLEPYCNEVVVQCDSSLDIFFDKWNRCREAASVGGYGIPICNLAARFGNLSAPAEWLDFGDRNVVSNKIGIVASGSPGHANNRNRSCPVSYFSILSECGDLFNLSPTAANTVGITDSGSLDWAVTIENVLSCALVVAVDTSIVHLCGALGVPCIMLQPLRETDFRWGNRNEDWWTSYWYPSVTVVRNSGDWKKTFAKVVECINQ